MAVAPLLLLARIEEIDIVPWLWVFALKSKSYKVFWEHRIPVGFMVGYFLPTEAASPFGHSKAPFSCQQTH